MEIKIYDNNLRMNKNNSKELINNDSKNFSTVFNQVVLKSKITDDTTIGATTLKDDIKTGNKLIDNLPDKNKSDVLYAIGKLDDIFGIDILGDPGKFFKKDSTINITRILGLYGNNVSSSELSDLSKYSNTLMENGLISNEDYFALLKWIQTKQEAVRVQMKFEKNKDSISDLMWKPKKS